MTEQVDYAEFYRRISNLVSDTESGTVFLKNDKNHLVMIGVHEGRIVSLACGPKRGESAIPLIQDSRTGTLRLARQAIPFHANEIPPTREILSRLNPFTWPEQSLDSPVSDSTSTASAEGNIDGLFAEATGKAEKLSSLLMDFIGPVAPLVCEEKISAAGGLSGYRQLEVVIQRLAGEIENEHEAQDFVTRARRAVGLTEQGDHAEPRDRERTTDTVVQITAEARATLRELLTDYIGPVAPIICEENIDKLGTQGTTAQLRSVIDNIALEIENRSEAKEFVAKAWRRLQSLAD